MAEHHESEPAVLLSPPALYAFATYWLESPRATNAKSAADDSASVRAETDRFTEKASPSRELAQERRRKARLSAAAIGARPYRTSSSLLTAEEERTLGAAIESGDWLFQLEEDFEAEFERDPSELEVVQLILLQLAASLEGFGGIARSIGRANAAWLELIDDGEFQQRTHCEVDLALRTAVSSQLSITDAAAEELLVRCSILSNLVSGKKMLTLIKLLRGGLASERAGGSPFELAQVLSTHRDAFSTQCVEAVHEIKSDYLHSAQRMVEANLRLVSSLVRKTNRHGVSFEDSEQEGRIGLMRAVDKYDHRTGFRFSTYATWWIRQAVSRAVADSGRTIRVPVHMFEQIKLHDRLAEELRWELGREPGVEEVADGLGKSVDQIAEIRRASQVPESLSAIAGPEEEEIHFEFDDDDPDLTGFGEPPGFSVEELAGDAERSIEQGVLRSSLSEDLAELLSGLSPRERQVLELRFGLGDGRARTLEEIGRDFDVTRERIRQIEAKALRQLRHPTRATRLRDYIE